MDKEIRKEPSVKYYYFRYYGMLASIVSICLAILFFVIYLFSSGKNDICIILAIIFTVLCCGSIPVFFTYLKKQKAEEEMLSEDDQKSVDLEIKKFKDRTNKIISHLFVYLFLTVCAVLAFLPFYWMIMSSFKTEMEFRESVPTFFPRTFQWKNYSVVLAQADSNGSSFIQIFLNTIVIGFVSTALSTILIIVTAYALARMEFAGKELLFTLMLGTMMIPGELFTLTNYLTVTSFGWKNTFTVMIVPFLVSIYYIYLLRNNFKQIPESLYKAAKVDGLSDMGYLIKVMVPLTAPTLISVTLLKFIGTWNSYIWPKLINDKEWQLITNWVTRGFSDKAGTLYGGFYNSSESLNTLKMAAVCIVSLPLLVLFICFRKYIMHGVSKSGIKG